MVLHVIGVLIRLILSTFLSYFCFNRLLKFVNNTNFIFYNYIFLFCCIFVIQCYIVVRICVQESYLATLQIDDNEKEKKRIELGEVVLPLTLWFPSFYISLHSLISYTNCLCLLIWFSVLFVR